MAVCKHDGRSMNNYTTLCAVRECDFLAHQISGCTTADSFRGKWRSQGQGGALACQNRTYVRCGAPKVSGAYADIIVQLYCRQSPRKMRHDGALRKGGDWITTSDVFR